MPTFGRWPAWAAAIPAFMAHETGLHLVDLRVVLERLPEQPVRGRYGGVRPGSPVRRPTGSPGSLHPMSMASAALADRSWASNSVTIDAIVSTIELWRR